MTSDAPRRMLAQVGFNQGRDQHDGPVHHMKDMCLRPNALGGLDQNTARRRTGRSRTCQWLSKKFFEAQNETPGRANSKDRIGRHP